VQTTTAAADADAATTAEAAAADNHTAKGAPSGLPIFFVKNKQGGVLSLVQNYLNII
jgi:hypothetical protein